jgi:hypothetical protein
MLWNWLHYTQAPPNALYLSTNIKHNYVCQIISEKFLKIHSTSQGDISIITSCWRKEILYSHWKRSTVLIKSFCKDSVTKQCFGNETGRHTDGVMWFMVIRWARQSYRHTRGKSGYMLWPIHTSLRRQHMRNRISTNSSTRYTAVAVTVKMRSNYPMTHC